MRMMVNICCCLLAFILGCDLAAAIEHKIIREKEFIILHCPLPLEGNVTWTREHSGGKVDILTADRNMRRINDTRFRSLPDQSLFILRPAASDSGRYLCNNEPAVQLTVISRDERLLFGWMFGITATLFIIFIITVLFTGRCRSKNQGNEEKDHICHYVVDSNRSDSANGEKQEVLRETLPGNEEDPIFQYIADGPSQGKCSLYSLLQKPKGKGNDDNHFLHS